MPSLYFKKRSKGSQVAPTIVWFNIYLKKTPQISAIDFFLKIFLFSGQKIKVFSFIKIFISFFFNNYRSLFFYDDTKGLAFPKSFNFFFDTRKNNFYFNFNYLLNYIAENFNIIFNIISKANSSKKNQKNKKLKKAVQLNYIFIKKRLTSFFSYLKKAFQFDSKKNYKFFIFFLLNSIFFEYKNSNFYKRKNTFLKQLI